MLPSLKPLVGAGLVLALGASVPIAFVHAQDRPDGEQLFETCLGCHGIEGYKNNYPTYKVPKLGGQNRQYVIDALSAYQDGKRPHATMQAQAHSLSKGAMRAIAAYLSGVTEVDGDAQGAAPTAAATCTACHGLAGKATAPNFPNLAGQHEDYLKHALEAYRSGERVNAIMAGFAAQLDDETIAALAAYYSMQDGLVTVER